MTSKIEELILCSRVKAEQIASILFNAFVDTWRNKLPSSAVIEHVGATAVPGCLTKGDLDICIRVDPNDFATTEAQLAQAFARNLGSTRNDAFAAFTDEKRNPPLGVQLVTKGCALDMFTLFRDQLRESPALLSAYNDLKRQYEGCDMEEYRNAKADFLDHAVSQRS